MPFLSWKLMGFALWAVSLFYSIWPEPSYPETPSVMFCCALFCFAVDAIVAAIRGARR